MKALFNTFEQFFDTVCGKCLIRPVIPKEPETESLEYVYTLIATTKDDGGSHLEDYAFLLVGLCCILLYDNNIGGNILTSDLDRHFKIKDFNDQTRSIIENIRHAFVHARIETTMGKEEVQMTNVSFYDKKNLPLSTKTTKRCVVEGYISCMPEIESKIVSTTIKDYIASIHEYIENIHDGNFDPLNWTPMFLTMNLFNIMQFEIKYRNLITIFKNMESICKESGTTLNYSRCLFTYCNGIGVDAKQIRNSLSHEKPEIYNSVISIKIKNATVAFTIDEYLEYCNRMSLYYKMPFLLLAVFNLRAIWDTLPAIDGNK